MRLIDADALKALPFNRLIHTDFGDTCVSFEEIDNAQTVTPTFGLFKEMLCSECEKRPQGEWVSLSNGTWMNCGRQCSLCGKVVEFSENFCPNCGADMRGDNDG